MNRWREIWQAKGRDFEAKSDIFEMFCELKKADGFDVQTDGQYYKNFWNQWHEMKNRIEERSNGYQSVYEVGCGSGVNLYLFQKLCGINNLGGCDYSESLLKIAKTVLPKDCGKNCTCQEALELETDTKYDVLLSDSVFQYFSDAEYGMKVLERMYEKSNKLIVITEVHDLEKKDMLLAHRRASIENYDEIYHGLDKTFYAREDLERFAKNHRCRMEIIRVQNESYWNSDYVFDCYFIKNNV